MCLVTQDIYTVSTAGNGQQPFTLPLARAGVQISHGVPIQKAAFGQLFLPLAFFVCPCYNLLLLTHTQANNMFFTKMELNIDQENSLIGNVAALFTAEGIEVFGMEITTVTRQNEYYKVFFSYENAANRLRTGWVCCKFHLVDKGIEDFVEIK
jgi:hypothetical protein